MPSINLMVDGTSNASNHPRMKKGERFQWKEIIKNVSLWRVANLVKRV